eukprot:5100761-Pleurochrysis_carterae.AAC.1
MGHPALMATTDITDRVSTLYHSFFSSLLLSFLRVCPDAWRTRASPVISDHLVLGAGRLIAAQKICQWYVA